MQSPEANWSARVTTNAIITRMTIPCVTLVFLKMIYNNMAAAGIQIFVPDTVHMNPSQNNEWLLLISSNSSLSNAISCCISIIKLKLK